MARNEFVSTSIKTPLRVRHDISHVYFCPLFNSPYCARASSLLMLNDRTQTHHTRQESSGRVISPAQRYLPDSTQHSQETYIHVPGGIRTHNPTKRATWIGCINFYCYYFYCLMHMKCPFGFSTSENLQTKIGEGMRHAMRTKTSRWISDLTHNLFEV